MSSCTPTTTRSDVLERFHFLRQQMEQGRQRAVPLARRLHRAEGDRACPITSAAFAVTSGHRPEGTVRPVQGRARRLQRHHGRGDRRSAGRSVCRMPAQAGARRMGLRSRREPEPRGADPGEVSRHPAGGGLSRRARITPRRARSGGCSTCEANTGMQITESFAMWPGSSVSGLYFAHPESRYFSLGKIDRDQVARLSRAQGHERRRGRALARAEPQLRS